ncbi:Sigma-70, region 4 [Geodermatophilus dictyosporus]|uniref:Sigma-70, region 4 n=1 Tax=Geodermatophilus dictyosporus TaxID=1523247 RepID=A0A1I5U2K4_9ACTN|nr:sigma factor-like helix-turn-helix DNA-binding protein [Geodermatophilus dictyosporus]SFP89499.1 Sigma-70, region 4 [Geodermatophilus dictyosporus]
MQQTSSSADQDVVLRWIDAFPWIGALSGEGDGEGGWWLLAVDPPASTARWQRLGWLAEMAIERLTRWTIGQIFPGLPGSTDLGALNLPTRIRNACMREGYSSVAELQVLYLEDVLGWHYVGVGSVESLLRTLGDAAMTRTDPLPERAAGPAAQLDLLEWSTTVWPADWTLTTPTVAPVLDEMRRLATFQALIGRADESMLVETPSALLPWELRELQRRLRDLSATDVIGEDVDLLSASAVIDAALRVFEPRVLAILAQRFFADEPRTLDEIGRQLEVTRERVRQLEGKARARLISLIDQGGSLADLAAVVRSRIDGLLPLADLLVDIPALGERVPAVGWPAWRVIDRIDDAYEIEDGWCAAPSMAAARDRTHARLQDLADRHGVVPLADYGDLNQVHAAPDPLETLRNWLQYCGYVVDGTFVYIRTQSVDDRAAAILSVTGSPLSAQELVDRFEVERSAGSLRNAMSTDDRFIRVDRDRWALAEWGHEAYGGIKDVIRQQVAQGGGSVPLTALIEYATSRYSVSANSVTAYANAHPFETIAGTVRLSRGDRTARKTPSRTRRLYRRSDSWVYRITVTNDHLRGSGSVAPIAIAGVVDLAPDRTVYLESPLGRQAIAWTGIQPAFGTIRRFLARDDAAPGEEFFCVIADGGWFDLQRVAPLSGAPLQAALRLSGQDDALTGADALTALSAAIGLPEHSTAVTVLGGFRERGDQDIADLLTSARHLLEETQSSAFVDADVNEILDLL